MQHRLSDIIGGSEIFNTAHTGMVVYDVHDKKELFNRNGDQYFLPASTVKLFTLFAGLKYLPDSLVGAKIGIQGETLLVQASGDPTFLHPDFASQPLFQLLKRDEVQQVKLYTPFAANPLGAGWAWDDYKMPFSAERDPFPMYGNLATIIYDYSGDSISAVPNYIKPFVIGQPEPGGRWSVDRDLGGHIYIIDTTRGNTEPVKQITMSLNKGTFASRYLADTLHKPVQAEYYPPEGMTLSPVFSHPKDSLFKRMMHKSDNFFAEQTLLMAANEWLGEMNDSKMIDTLLRSDFRLLPQPPRWVDGSGLSRYNLFSPKDIIWVLNRLQSEYGLSRMQTILPHANEGTLKGILWGYENNVWAKTGSMSNHYCIGGYLLTKSNKWCTFSFMVNNSRASVSDIKQAVEVVLKNLIEKY